MRGRRDNFTVEIPVGLGWWLKVKGGREEIIAYCGAGHDEGVEDGESEVLGWRWGMRETPLAL